MASPHSDSYDSHTRKRVGKACDRCRLKKSKCDGANPCNRCKVDNAICVFGERKKSHDKVYPKGYVEMLEQQQSQLVAGVRQMYKKLVASDHWPGAPLHEHHEGHPLTHDILDSLHVLHMTGDNPVGPESFEDDLERLQQRLLDSGAAYDLHHARRSSPSTDSDPGLAHSEHSTPMMSAESSVSSRSSSGRKRSPPTPTQEPPPHRGHRASLNVPGKQHRRAMRQQQLMMLQQQQHHRHHQYQEQREQIKMEQMQIEPVLYQEPWVMASPEMDGGADFTLYSSTGYDQAGAGMGGGTMFDPLGVHSAAAAMNASPMDMGGPWTAQDPDFDSFIRSGYHGSMV